MSAFTETHITVGVDQDRPTIILEVVGEGRYALSEQLANNLVTELEKGLEELRERRQFSD